MISEENKRLAQWAMDYALKNGCQQAKVSINTGISNSFSLRDGKMDQLQQTSGNTMRIVLFVDGRNGIYETNRLNKKELETFIKNGIEATRYIAKDEARVLPDASRYYKGGKPDLKQYDESFKKIDPDTKVAIAQAVSEEIMGKDPRIISVTSGYRDGGYYSYTVTSNGFESSNQRSSYSLNAGVSIRGEGEARPSSGWGESAMFYNELPKKDIGKTALERVLAKIGQKKIQSGKYTMIVEPRNTGQLLGPLLSAIQGAAIQQKNSFLMDKLGEQVVSSKMTLIDSPHIIGANGARYYDGEGVATIEQPIFDAGVLKTYYINTYNANKMQCTPTISSPSLPILSMGDKDVDGLIKASHNAILVTGFNGGNCNSTTGNFSYGVEGFLIENGQLTQPTSEMNITGNMLTLWSSLVETGNDPNLSSSMRIPTLVFEGVDFSGI